MWEFALSTTTLLSISGHFKQFHLNDLLNQLTNLATFLDKLPASLPPNYSRIFFASTEVV